MPQKIYYGNVELVNTRTHQKIIVENQIYKELDNINDASIRNKILIHLKPKEQEQFKIYRFCFDTAKYLGDTVY